MSVITLEGTVENGQIKLSGNVQLPEKTRVFVVVPNWRALKETRLYSPRLVNPEQAADFRMEVFDMDKGNGDLQS